jgi:hypothetical protein
VAKFLESRSDCNGGEWRGIFLATWDDIYARVFSKNEIIMTIKNIKLGRGLFEDTIPKATCIN